MKTTSTVALLFTLCPIFINGDSSIKVTLKTQNISSSLSSSLASVYYGEMSLGTPKQSFNFTFDTTSDLILIPGVNCTGCATNMTKFNSTASSTFVGGSGSGNATLNRFGYVTYTLFSDNLIVSEGLKVTNQTFGLVTSVTNTTFNGISGFAGLGPGNNSFVRNVLNQNNLSSVFSLTIYSSPTDNKQAGEIILGGVTTTKSIVTITSHTSDTQWTFEIQKISVGNTSIPCTSCYAQISILDNPYISGANATIQAIYKAINANSTGYVTKSDNLTSVSFTIGGTSFNLTSKDYLQTCDNGTCSTAFIEDTTLNDTQLIFGTVFVSKYRWIFNLTSKEITIANGSSSALQPALVILTSLVAWACLRQEPFQSIMY